MEEKQQRDASLLQVRHVARKWSLHRLLLALPLLLTVLYFAQLQPGSLSFIIAPFPPCANSSPTAILQQGTYTGIQLKNSNHRTPIEAWLGIPYAQPPVDSLRFARPQELPPSNDTFLATAYGYRCPGKQLLNSSNTPPASEDCLTANIFRQRDKHATNGSNLPIAVYIHGGAFNRGYSSMHDTASFLSYSTEPFLAMSFNYRIGALGFLNSALTAKHQTLNLGLHDQKLLLSWVQANAEAFGGDAGNVTLIGLSAGAHSIGHHIMDVNQKLQLFHKAVIESGGPTSRAVHPWNSTLHEEQYQQFLAEVGCAGLGEDGVMPCLRIAPSESIVLAQQTVFDSYNPSVRWAWQPVLDDEIISRRPLDAWRSGEWHQVPILTGFNHNEGTMYVPRKMQRANEFRQFFSALLPQLTGSDLDELERLYPDPATNESSPYVDTRNLTALGLGAQYKRVEAAYGHYAYVCPVRQTAHFASSISSQRPIYLYHWALNSSVVGGANHADQMWYETMSKAVRGVSETHAKIAGRFHDYLASFVVTGNPNTVPGSHGRGLGWSAFGGEPGSRNGMIFGGGNDERAGGSNVGVATSFVDDRWAKEECTFWWRMSGIPED